MEGPDALLVPLSPALLHLRHRPNIYTTPTADHSGVYAVYRMYSRVYAVPVGQSPTRPGGGGATPTLKIHGVLFYTGPCPNQTERIETKQNETKKKTVSSEKPKA